MAKTAAMRSSTCSSDKDGNEAMSYPELITLEAVRDQVRQVGLDDDLRLERIRKHAQKLVIDYCKVADDAYDEELPPHIEAAMLRVAEALFDGDVDPLAPVVSILARSRSPALA